MTKAVAVCFCAAAIIIAAPAGAATWEYSTNGKGNHYLVVLANPYSVTFACNGKKIIGFFSVPLSELGEEFKRAKVAYTIARVDGREDGSGRYAWFSGKTDVSNTDVNFNMDSGAQVIKLLRDINAAESNLSIGVSLENPAKGRFATRHSALFGVDGAAEAIPEIFEACNIP